MISASWAGTIEGGDLFGRLERPFRASGGFGDPADLGLAVIGRACQPRECFPYELLVHDLLSLEGIGCGGGGAGSRTPGPASVAGR